MDYCTCFQKLSYHFKDVFYVIYAIDRINRIETRNLLTYGKTVPKMWTKKAIERI